MKFRYREYRVKPSPFVPSGIVTRPEITVKAVGSAGEVEVEAVVDTGADITLLPRWIAEHVGVVVDDTARRQLGGIAGQVVEASPGDVELEITSNGSFYRWTTTVAFVSYPAGSKPLAILGHAGFLEFFRVPFDCPARELEVQATPAFGGTSG